MTGMSKNSEDMLFEITEWEVDDLSNNPLTRSLNASDTTQEKSK